jgi:hypothetical protein
MDNILVEAPPTTIEIEGQEHEVNWDFRTCLRVILAFEDLELTMIEKTAVMLELLYKDRPDNIQLAIEKGIAFLDGGIEHDPTSSGARIFSFQKDSRLVMAGFRQTYQMDLQVVDLHWWTFLTLFMDLGPDTTFSNLVNLRKRVKDGNATKEERQTALDLGEMFDLPDLWIKTIEELEAEKMFFDALGKDKK